MRKPEVYLIVEKGEPYQNGDMIILSGEPVILGRSWQSHRPDIAFSSMLISRRHALINCRNDVFCLTDMASKHGTQVNGFDLPSDEPCLLRHGDKIALAKGTVLLVFNHPAEEDADNTVDFTGLSPEDNPASGLVVRPDRREVLADGTMLNLSGKDLELLMLLYRNRGRAVSYDEIKYSVWPERRAGAPGGIPDVGNDEITTLIYRLRKRLERYGEYIVAVPRYGYMLDM